MLSHLTTWPLFALPFLPFYIAWHLPFPFISGRTLLFRLLVEVAFFAWVGLTLSGKGHVHRLNTPITFAVALFLLTVGIANTLGVSPSRSFLGNYERLEGYILLLHCSALFVILTTVVTMTQWRVYVALFVLSGILASLSAFLPIWPGGGLRSGAVFGNPTFLAVYCLLTGGLAVLLSVQEQARWKRMYYWVVAGGQLVMIGFIGTRGVWIGLAAGGIAALCIAAFRARAMTILAGQLAGLIVAGFLIAPTVPILIRTDPSAGARVSVWRSSLRGLADRPLLGWGQENTALVLRTYGNPRPFADRPYDRAHNILLDWGLSAGLLGVLAYLSLFGCAFSALWKRGGRASVVIASLLVAYFVQNMFAFDTLMSYVLFFSLLGYSGRQPI